MIEDSKRTDGRRRIGRLLKGIRRGARQAFVGLFVLSFMVSMVAGPVAAQTGQNTTACQYGPPIPSDLSDGTESGDEEVELALTLDGTTFSGLSDQEQIIESSSKDIVGKLDSGDEASVVTFSDPTQVLQILSGDLDEVNQSIEQYGVGASTSYIDRGIDASTDELLNSANATENATKVMVMLSDGNANDPAAARTAATNAKDAGILVITVAFGDNPNTALMEDLATSPEYAYSGTSDLEALLEEVEQDLVGVQENQIRIETRDLYTPGSTHPYRVYNLTYGIEDNETVVIDRSEITDAAAVESSNTSVLSVDAASTSLVATDDVNTSTWVRVNASYQGESGCTNVVVAEPTVENLRLIPGIWRIVAVAGDSTLFALLIATLLAVPAARYTSAFGGLAIGEMVMVVGWLGGYVGFGIAAASVFVSLFIGLNLAANINYMGGTLGGGR